MVIIVISIIIIISLSLLVLLQSITEMMCVLCERIGVDNAYPHVVSKVKRKLKPYNMTNKM